MVSCEVKAVIKLCQRVDVAYRVLESARKLRQPEADIDRILMKISALLGRIRYVTDLALYKDKRSFGIILRLRDDLIEYMHTQPWTNFVK